MKQITIIETRNGVMVVVGAMDDYEKPQDLAGRSWSFNSLDKAIARIRLVLKEWRVQVTEAAGGK